MAGINDVSISQCVDWLLGLWCGEWVYAEKRGWNSNVHVHLGVCEGVNKRDLQRVSWGRILPITEINSHQTTIDYSRLLPHRVTADIKQTLSRP